eukprot:TRINITY_DN1428_c0_g1_i3.p2 TRINITY_DN1428_c0_g1~~TRINITY_DN1428_c0_g1_i3.p2  ORF type:complete len:209 (+),score=61.96 TRINITY_DN1428_c0_g1_i3:1415-2041(+)
MNGMNVSDYYDPDIMKKLALLEEEENERLRAEAEGEEMEEDEELGLTAEDLAELREWWESKKMARLSHITNTLKNHVPMPIKDVKKTDADLNQFENHLIEMGINPTKAMSRIRSRSQAAKSVVRKGRKRRRADDEDTFHKRNAGSSRGPRQNGLRDTNEAEHVQRIERLQMRKRNKLAKRGESDRVIWTEKPKFLFSGKRGNGKTDWR